MSGTKWEADAERRQQADTETQGRVLVAEVGDGTADLELYGEQQMNEIHLRRMATDEARTPPQTPPQRPLYIVT